MKDQEYHIDVTPEEDNLFRDQLPETITPEKKKPAFGRVFWVVAGAHVAAIGALMATCSAMSSKPAIDLTKPVDEMPQNLPKELTEVKPEYTEESSPSVVSNVQPIISEPHVSEVKPIQTQSAIEPAPNVKQTPLSPSIKNVAKEYVVKKGDTVYSISKKFKLNTKRLLEINNTKDPNKIVVGQKLKFM